MNIFSYESKFSQTLMFVADLCILNLLFVLCSLPIFTIGAAQAALFSGVKVLVDPEDDTSPAKAFWKGFRTGFGSVTLAWGAFALAMAAMGALYLLVVAYGQTIAGATVPIWMCLIALVVLLLLQSQIPLFHARFACSAGQLLRNSCMILIAHPLRSILVALLLWLPVIAMYFIKSFVFFLMISLTFILLYYAVAFMLSFYIMKKPFTVLIDHYNATHDEDGNVRPMMLDEEGNLIPAVFNEDGTLSPAPQPEAKDDEAEDA